MKIKIFESHGCFSSWKLLKFEYEYDLSAQKLKLKPDFYCGDARND